MPSRSSVSPPAIPRTSNSPVAMSLAETSRPLPEPHHLHIQESYMFGAGSQNGLHQSTYNMSDLILPPLQTRQPPEQTYNSYRRDPNPRSYNSSHDQQWPITSTGHVVNQPHQSSSFPPVNRTTAGLNNRSVSGKPSHDNLTTPQLLQSRDKGWRPDVLNALPPGNTSLRPYEPDIPRSTFQQHPEGRKESDLALTFDNSRLAESKIRFEPRTPDSTQAEAQF